MRVNRLLAVVVIWGVGGSRMWVPGGRTGVGVISLHGALLSAPSRVTPEYVEFS